MNESLKLLYDKLHDSQMKHTYYLLGVDVVAVGFVITSNPIIILKVENIFLFITMLLLSISFLLGCRYIEYVNSSLYSNSELIQIENGKPVKGLEIPEYRMAAIEGIRQALENNSNKANKLARWQSRTMLIGFFMYFVNIIYISNT